jgi:hypothetical protein
MFEEPRRMWHGRKHCHGYKNEEILAKYVAEQERHETRPKKEEHRAHAKAAKAETHHNGDRHVAITIKAS